MVCFPGAVSCPPRASAFWKQQQRPACPHELPFGDSLFLAPSHQASVFKETRGHLMSQLGALEHEGAPEKGHFPNSFSQAPL